MSCKREGPGGPSRFLWASLSASGYVSGRAACNRSCVACGDAYLWVADPRQVTFLCLSKEKSPKEKTPRSRRLPPALLGKIGARLTRRAHTTRLGLQQKARCSRFSLRCSAAATGTRKPRLIFSVRVFALQDFSLCFKNVVIVKQ